MGSMVAGLGIARRRSIDALRPPRTRSFVSASGSGGIGRSIGLREQCNRGGWSGTVGWARVRQSLQRVHSATIYAKVRGCGMMVMASTQARSIFDVERDEAVEARLDAEAEAAYAAGRAVPHAKVAEWLNSWGTPDELPCPTPKVG